MSHFSVMRREYIGEVKNRQKEKKNMKTILVFLKLVT